MAKKCSDFPIGARVKYFNPESFIGDGKEIVGTITRHWHGGDRHVDPETGKPYVTPDSATVRVHEIPANWPYLKSMEFAPDVEHLTLL